MVLWLAMGWEHPARQGCCPPPMPPRTRGVWADPAALPHPPPLPPPHSCLMSSVHPSGRTATGVECCGKTQTQGMSPALGDPAPSPCMVGSHDCPPPTPPAAATPCLPPPSQLPVLPPPPWPSAPGWLMDPDSAALFLTTRRLAASGGTQPAWVPRRSPREVALHRAAVPHHIAARCPCRWAAALAPLSGCRGPWSLAGRGCALGGWLAQ